MKIKIAPSILSADFSNLMEDIKKIEKAGVDLLHIDIMDGHFVPNITIGPVVLDSIKGKTNLPFDVHLMIEEPIKYAQKFKEAGASIICFHAEVVHDIDNTIKHINKLGIKTAISINPKTPLSLILSHLDAIDMVLLMTVNPGFAGQAFMPEVLPKIRELRKYINENNIKIDIEVDGGIGSQNVKDVVKAGANVVVAGSAIFKAKDPVEEVKKIRKQVESIEFEL
jgi:ribulose-phosphate 3-epimerase